MPKNSFEVIDPFKGLLGEAQKPAKSSREKIPQSIRYQVWDKYISPKKIEGKCYCCGLAINNRDFEVGHNKAVAKGGKNHISNLRPVCKHCNRSMGTQSIEQYKRKYYGKPTEVKKANKTKAKPKKKKSSNFLGLQKTKFPSLL